MKIRDASLENQHLRIVLSGESGGGLRSVLDKATGRDFIAATAQPLYRLTAAEPGREAVELTSRDAESLEIERASSPAGETLVLRFGPHRGLDLRVTCRVTLPADSTLSYWRISIENPTASGVRGLLYPVVCCPSALGADDCYINGSWGGLIIPKPGERSLGPRRPWDTWFPTRQYPGLVSVQMQAYYDATAGLYLAAHDSSGGIKQFGPFRDGDALDITIEHNFDETPGRDFELPYDSVLGVFHGDWYDAADIYKQWAHSQHWCARKLGEREDVPGWVKEPRPCLMMISQGNVERARATLPHPPAEFPLGNVYPARKAVARGRRCATLFGTPVSVWMEGFERIGSPGGPVEIFPPREGEESYAAAMAEFARDGTPVLMYLAGLHWCYKRPTTGYDDWPRFEREGLPMAVVNAQGGLDLSTPAARHYHLGQKYFAPLCVGSSQTQDLFARNFDTLMDLGAVALQLDQQTGFYSDVCYSDQHDHPPGYGPWMYRKMLEFVRRVRTAGKRRNPNATLSVEEPCEIWIQELDFPMDRPYMGGTIPLFQYLYHEYATAFGGDIAIGYCHPEVSLIKHATIFVRGVQNLVSVGEPEYDYEIDPDYPIFPLLRNICRAQRTYARDYVVFGQMQRPTPLETGRVTVDYFRSSKTAEVPKVLHSVWRSQSGRMGYVMVNWTGEAAEATLTLRGDGAASIVTDQGRTPLPAETRRAGKVTLTIPARNVALVEQG